MTDDFPANYMILDTRTHRRGVLQIMGVADNPRSVKIRYRLVEGAAVKKTSQTAQPAAPKPSAIDPSEMKVGAPVIPTFSKKKNKPTKHPTPPKQNKKNKKKNHKKKIKRKKRKKR